MNLWRSQSLSCLQHLPICIGLALAHSLLALPGQKRVRRPWRRTLTAKGLRRPAQLLLADEAIVGRAKRLKQYRFHRWRRAHRRTQAASDPAERRGLRTGGPRSPTPSLKGSCFKPRRLRRRCRAEPPGRGGIGLSHSPARRLMARLPILAVGRPVGIGSIH